MWIAAVAAWAGVLVNALIVGVALSPIRTAKRERAARGRLVAASLVIPMRIVHGLLDLSAKDLAALMASEGMPQGPTYDQILGNLKDAVEKAPPLLACFNVREAAWLDYQTGERLARTVSAANAAFLGLSSLLVFLAQASKSMYADRVFAARAEAVKPYAYLPANFRSTAEQVGEFTAYCDCLLPPMPHVPVERASPLRRLMQRLSWHSA